VSYEHEYLPLKDATFPLELALWKSKIDQTGQTGEQITADTNTIIPNILPYAAVACTQAT
jgi:hypothetical protein